MEYKGSQKKKWLVPLNPIYAYITHAKRRPSLACSISIIKSQKDFYQSICQYLNITAYKSQESSINGSILTYLRD